MFVIVKHEGRELRVNPNCYIRITYDYIREQLSIPPDREFDLYSADGSPCFIYRHRPDTDGKTILKPRQTYTLEMLRIDEDEDVEGEGLMNPEVELAISPSAHGSVEDHLQESINE